MESISNLENSNINPNNTSIKTEKGYMAFFQEEDYHLLDEPKVLFPEMVQNEKFKKFSNDLKSKRNKMLYICLFQILASCMGMAYMVFRRSYIYLAINLVTLTLAFSGGYGALVMNYLYIILHCIFTISLPGAFFFYTIIDFFLARDPGDHNEKRASETLIFFIFSLPYLYDLCAGIFCFFFVLNISRNLKECNYEQDRIKEEYVQMKQKYSSQEISDHFKNIDENLCVICMDNRRDTALTPCGHYLCCYECAQRLFGRFSFKKPNCPICRKECQSYMKIISS